MIVDSTGVSFDFFHQQPATSWQQGWVYLDFDMRKFLS